MSVERERARPLLGTVVAVRARAGDLAAADRAIDAAFARIARVHAAMSFQSAESDLTRIGEAQAGDRAPLRPDTRACLDVALTLAAETGGAFDPVLPGSGASWRDLEVGRAGVRVGRPLRIDLSGIAKGYAVDRGCEALQAAGVLSGVINAGGDLRVLGPDAERVALRPRVAAPPAAVSIREGALASSDALPAEEGRGEPAHRDGRTGAAAAMAFAAVAAPRCVHADALTKVVLALGEGAGPVLRAYGARAWRFAAAEGWRTLGSRA